MDGQRDAPCSWGREHRTNILHISLYAHMKHVMYMLMMLTYILDVSLDNLHIYHTYL